MINSSDIRYLKAQSYINQVASKTTHELDRAALVNFIFGLYELNVWDKVIFWLFLPDKNTGSSQLLSIGGLTEIDATALSSVNFSLSGGAEFDGKDSFINTNFNPFTNNLSSISACIFVDVIEPAIRRDAVTFGTYIDSTKTFSLNINKPNQVSYSCFTDNETTTIKYNSPKNAIGSYASHLSADTFVAITSSETFVSQDEINKDLLLTEAEKNDLSTTRNVILTSSAFGDPAFGFYEYKYIENEKAWKFINKEPSKTQYTIEYFGNKTWKVIFNSSTQLFQKRVETTDGFWLASFDKQNGFYIQKNGKDIPITNTSNNIYDLIPNSKMFVGATTGTYETPDRFTKQKLGCVGIAKNIDKDSSIELFNIYKKYIRDIDVDQRFELLDDIIFPTPFPTRTPVPTPTSTPTPTPTSTGLVTPAPSVTPPLFTAMLVANEATDTNNFIGEDAINNVSITSSTENDVVYYTNITAQTPSTETVSINIVINNTPRATINVPVNYIKSDSYIGFRTAGSGNPASGPQFYQKIEKAPGTMYFDNFTSGFIFQLHPTPTPTVSPTESPTPMPCIVPTSTPTATIEITPTSTVIPTSTPTSTNSPTPTQTNTPSPTNSPTPSSTPSPTPSFTPSSTPTLTPSTTPSPTPSNTPTSSPTSTPTLTPSITPSPTPTPVRNFILTSNTDVGGGQFRGTDSQNAFIINSEIQGDTIYYTINSRILDLANTVNINIVLNSTPRASLTLPLEFAQSKGVIGFRPAGTGNINEGPLFSQEIEKAPGTIYF
jgi:hypothetical protein